MNSGTNATFSGVIRNGVGAPTFTLGLLKSGANTVTLTGANTYTGATTMNQGRLAVEGQFGALGNTAITVGDNNGADESMTFGQVGDVWTTGSTVNRIGDTGTLTLNGRVPVTYTGPASGSTGFNEVLGAFTTSAAFNTLTLVAGTGAADVQFSPASLARNSAGTQLVRGNGLGTTGGSTRLVSASPGTVGGGGAAGSQTQSIVPWMLGDSSQTGIGQSFLAHDAVNGLRPLLNAEYDIALAGAQTSRNVSISGGETVVANTVVNALRVTGGITTIGAGTRATVRTGAVLFTSAGTIAGPGFVDFGLTDGIISNANSAQTTVNLGARLAGGGGLTYSSAGLITNVLNLSGDNTSLSGNLTINTGTVQLGSATALNAKYPMTVIPRIASVLQLNGNSVTIRNLQAAGGGGSYQNGAATPATLTTYLTAGQNVDTALANGGAGALSLILSGGTSTLTITADASATGTAEIRTGSMTLNGTNGTINDMTAVTIQGGATLRLTNTSTANNTNRVSNAAALMMNGGTLDFDNNASAAVISESIDGLTIGAGANAITVDKGNSVTNSSVLTFSSLVGRNAGATLNLASQNNGAAIFDLGTLGNSRLVFTTAPTLDDGIIGGWATIDSSANTREFVKHVADADTVTAGNQPSITALVSADYAATLSSGANPAQNVKITATPIALSAATQINSLNLAQATATTVDIGAPNTLRVESGGIIVSGAVSSTIFTNGTLTAGNGAAAGGDLVIHTLPTANSAVSWVNASDTVSLGNVVNGTPVVFGTAPGGLTGGVTYYVINSTATTFQVALSPGGALVAITSDGTTASMNRFYSSTVTSIISDNGANPVNLVKAGGGILVPSGANTYTGKTYINGGQLRVSADNNLGGGIGTFAADKLVLSSGGTLDVPTSFTLDANRGITLGGGNNVISIGSGTAGNGKTLTYNGAIASTGAGEGSIQFRANLIPTAGIDPGRISANLSSVNITGSFRTDAGTVTLNGVSNTIGRSLQIGMDGTGTLTYTGAGSSLTVGKGINDTLDVGFNSSNILNTVGTLNLSGLGQFTANVDQVRVGGGSAAFTGQGTLTLATNNDITAGTQIIIGLTASVGNAAVTSTLTFGSGINNIATRSLTVGGDKSKANATVAAGGTVNLTGFGANTTDLFVANYFNTGTAGITSTFDMTGGTLNASLNTLAVGQKTGGNNGGNTGIFTVAGAGNVITANAVVVGRVDGNNTAGTNATAGTVNFGGGTLSVSNDVSLGLWSNNTTGTPTATGTLNITGGNVTVGGNITTTSSVSANATLTLNGGILDMTAGTINVDTFNAQTGTLKNVAQLQSGDGLTAIALNKNTAGTLIVDGTNLHTAGTAVSAGVLRATSDAALGALSSGVTISNAAILQAGGAITSSRTFTLGAGGGQIDTNGSTVTLGAASTVTGNVAGTQTLTKTGLGTLTLAGAQTYATLNANGGVTNVNSALGTGTSTLNANATTNINASQTLAALTIAAGVEVTFGDGLPFTGGPEKFGAPALVPEPGSLGLLLVGALGLVSRRRRA